MYTIVFAICICTVISFSISYAYAQTDDKISNSEYIKKLSKEGVSLLQEGKINEAIAIFDKILEIDSTDVVALSNKGSAFVSLGENDKGLEYFDKALEFEPQNTEVLNNKAATLANMNKIDEALVILEQILKIDPNDADAQNAKKILLSFSQVSKDIELNIEVEVVPTPIENSKYKASVQSQVRNLEGALISVGESKRISVLPNPITDEFLNSYPVIGKVFIDNIQYEEMQVVDISNPVDDRFTGKAVLDIKQNDDSIILFSALTHGYTVEKGDTVTHVWTIFRQIT